jgi:hypothetical protein
MSDEGYLIIRIGFLRKSDEVWYEDNISSVYTPHFLQVLIFMLLHLNQYRNHRLQLNVVPTRIQFQ